MEMGFRKPEGLNIWLKTIVLWLKMVNEIGSILKILIENQGKRFSIRKLSKLRDINYKSAYNNVKQLEKEELVSLEKFGNTTNCSFNRIFSPRVFEVEFKRREELLKDKNFKILHNRLKEAQFQFIALLFGSFAKKKSTKNSDIDIIVITENKEGLKQIINLIPLNIHLTVLTNKEFNMMAKSKEFSVVSEVIKNNAILIGIEDYYRLMENVE
tara:strand:- start:797 stop:1435 length:639 start_codon:yes stop_codon:yes gene_type:complete